MGLGPGFFELLNIFPPPPVCQQATSIQCVKYGNTYTCKSFCWHTGGGGMIFLKKSFRISIYLNVKLIVLPKINIFEAFNIENGFHSHKVLRSG